MLSDISSEIAVEVLREVIVSLLKSDQPALSAHQFGVFLTCYLRPDLHTVRGLATELDVSKSMITRALGKLCDHGLAQRQPDPQDRRNVLIERTPQGVALIDRMRVIAASYHVGRVAG